MATNFILTLDTTAPQGVTFVLNNDDAYTASVNVTGKLATTDPVTTGYQIKVWGDVVGAATEAAAVWVAYSAAPAITLTPGDGLKTVNVRVRDDVGNPSTVVTDTITLNTTAPGITITIAPDHTKISKITGFDTATFDFAVDKAIVNWTVRVVADPSAAHNTGTEIPVTAGSTNTSGGALGASTNQQVQIKGADLEAASAGDGDKIIKVFGVDAGGLWSV